MKKQRKIKATTGKGLPLLLAFVLMLSMVPAIALAGTGEMLSGQGAPEAAGAPEVAGVSETAGEATEPADAPSPEPISSEDPAPSLTDDTANEEPQPVDADVQQPAGIAPLAAGDPCTITFLVWQDGDIPEDPTSFTGSSTATAEEGALFEGTVPAPDEPTGYSFVEWHVQGTGAVFDLALTPIPGDITLYALYNEDSLADEEVDTFAELQSAIASASDGVLTSIVLVDTIPVTSTVTIPAGKKIRLTSAAGQTFALNGGGVVGVLTVEQGATLLLENITITGGWRTHGGGIVNSGILSIGSGAAITGNTAYAGRGSGVYNYDVGTLTMTGGVVSGNTSSVTLDDNTLGGGGIYNKGTFNLSGGEISGNNCTPAYYGGGVMNDGSFTMIGGSISNNTVAQGGGGIWNRGTFTMAGGTVTNHTKGGVRNGENALFNLQGGTISYNTNNEGSVANDVSGTIIMTGGSISHNESTQNGGGVTNSGTFTMNGGTISNNVAASRGGGVNNSGTFTLAGGEIVDNTATANNGGGICSMNSGTSELIITGGTISRNWATIGGGVSCSNILSMSGGTISNNTATTYGGGVYNATDSVFTMSGDAVISGNKADLGGGVHNRFATSTFTMSGGTLSGNEATSNGGGVYVSNGSVTIEAGTISNNDAANNGGGVWVTNTYTNLDRLSVEEGVVFSGNTAVQAYDRLPVDDATYKAQIGTDGAGVTWSGTFTQGYNNFDISYVRAGFRVTYHENWPGGVPGVGTAPVDSYVYHNGATAYLEGPGSLAKTGYTFKGWASSASATTPNYVYEGGALVPESLTIGGLAINLHAVWSKNVYTVTFQDWNGTTLGTQEVEYGDAATAPANPSRDGYTFIGWDRDFSSITSNLTVTAQYTPTPNPPVTYYTVTYLPGAYGTFTAQVTNGLTLGSATPAAPTITGQEGWSFAGWSPSPSVTVTGNAIYTAQWTEDPGSGVFTVRFVDFDGTLLKSEQVARGNDATAPASPTRDGYTFLRWDRSYTNVQGDITVTALYAVNVVAGENGGEGPGGDTVLSALSEDYGIPSITLGDLTIPLSAGPFSHLVWALLNLILAVIGILLALLVGIRAALRRRQSDEDTREERFGEEEQQGKKKRIRIIALVLTILLGIAGIVIFFLTEDMTLPMVLTDSWTVVNLIVLLLEILALALVFRREKKKEESYDENEAVQTV